jgi:hypothetical protein
MHLRRLDMWVYLLVTLLWCALSRDLASDAGITSDTGTVTSSSPVGIGKTTASTDASVAKVSPVHGRLAIVTLVTGRGSNEDSEGAKNGYSGFVSGAVALGQSIANVYNTKRKASSHLYKYDRIALVTPDVDDATRKSLSRRKLWTIREIPRIDCNVLDLDNPIFSKEKTLSWKATCSKFAAWSLVEYDRVVFMDADTLLLGPIDAALHNYSNASFLAAADVFPPDTFNTGFMVIRPSQTTFQRLVDLNSGIGSTDGGDQSLLNRGLCPHWYFADKSDAHCGRLPWIYNVNGGSYYAYSQFQAKSGAEKVAVVHFLGDVKPWTLLAYEYSEAYNLQNMPQKHRQVLINQAKVQSLWRDAFFKGMDMNPVANRLLGPILNQLEIAAT